MKRILRIGMDVHSTNYTLCAIEPRFDGDDIIYANVKVTPDPDNIMQFIENLQKKIKEDYDRMSTKICNNSLYCILPERYDVVNKGFHVLRRTFATTLLRNNAGIQMVMDSLGHTDNTSVMKYLSFDEERMRLCPLSLTQYSLLLEGGAV